MWVPANTIAAMPKGREDNTHLNIYGARVIAGITVDAIAKEVPELAKYVRHYDFVVAQDAVAISLLYRKLLMPYPISVKMYAPRYWCVKAYIKKN